MDRASKAEQCELAKVWNGQGDSPTTAEGTPVETTAQQHILIMLCNNTLLVTVSNKSESMGSSCIDHLRLTTAHGAQKQLQS